MTAKIHVPNSAHWTLERFPFRLPGFLHWPPRNFFDRRLAAESACAKTRPSGAGYSLFLFVYQTLHALVASFSGLCPWHFTRCRMDRHYRLAGLAHVNSVRCRDSVGGRG